MKTPLKTTFDANENDQQTKREKSRRRKTGSGFCAENRS
jgi:hypothetical protein